MDRNDDCLAWAVLAFCGKGARFGARLDCVVFCGQGWKPGVRMLVLCGDTPTQPCLQACRRPRDEWSRLSPCALISIREAMLRIMVLVRVGYTIW